MFPTFAKIPLRVAKSLSCGKLSAPHFTKPQLVMILTARLTPPLLCTLGALSFLFCANPQSVHASSSVGDVIRGKASFYGSQWHGRKTANGEIYDQNTLTAAHPTLSFGTKVLVKNLRNGREVTLRINNRGPYIKGRIIDVSKRAAQELRMTKAGVVPVEITILPKEAPVGVGALSADSEANITNAASVSQTSESAQDHSNAGSKNDSSKDHAANQESSVSTETHSKSLASTEKGRRHRLLLGR